MYKEIEEYDVRIVESLAMLMRRWTQHSKEATGRCADDLEKYSEKWNELVDFIIEIREELNKKEIEDYNNRDFVLADLVEHISYKGPLFRIHRKFDKRKKNKGVDFNGHWVSWSKAKDATAMYIFYANQELLRINAVADEEQFGIDLNKFFELFGKYSNGEDPWLLGPPPIIKEQEVIFPLKSEFVTSMEVIKNV